MNLDKKRWFVLIASCLINLCIGSLYAWSVFATPMAEHLTFLTGQEIHNLSIIFTIANSVGPITMITGGLINNKIHPKHIILGGGILFGIGMICSGFATSVSTLILSYGLGVGLAVGLIYGCTVSNTVKFFPDKKGLIGGITTASYGISSIIIPIVANTLITNLGVTTSFKVLGTVMGIIICVSSLFIEKCPPDYIPYNYKPEQQQQNATLQDKNWKDMLKDPLFYIMLTMLLCGAFSGLMITSQASVLAQRIIHASVSQAALIVSTLALFNTAGRIIAGYISDKIGAINTILLVFIVSITSLICLYFSSSEITFLFYIGILLAGFCFGSIMGIYPGFTAAQFGMRNNSVNYGIMFIGFALAGYFGPTIMATLYTLTESYKLAFIVAICFALIGILLTYLYKRKVNIFH